ncbi:protein of unknown function DUF21 [Thermocrinis albus DSM 14484]|uniref:CBS domain containing protein n=1 Tax=Thermocrinis albus (strain DSM 14484 / JCM 11386 / HI 11/12) TaxID=638303 RepID=D3SLK2_THEAH|nr:hemolysin family protein [Thermocrinis albus]ADC89632.1 protein of unknown function DUF21 [Thermocrinis albus DSM 14484]
MEGSLPAIFTDISVIIFFLFLSGFFSSSEVVLFGLNRYLLRRYQNKKIYPILVKLLRDPKQVLLSILLGNEIANVLISSYGTKIFVSLMGQEGAGLSVVLMSVLIFFLGEVIPKNVVLHYATRLSLLYAVPFYVVHQLLSPVRFLLMKPVERFLRALDTELKNPSHRDVFVELLEVGVWQGAIEEMEKSLAERALSFSEVTVKEVMTPRTELFLLEEESKVGEVWDKILKHKHSRIPLYRDNPDNVTGVVWVKDLIPVEDKMDKPLKDYKRDLLVVPHMLTLDRLLAEMKAAGSQMAVVVGEHGDLVGIVTLHDLLEFIFEELPESWEEDIVKISREAYKVYGWVDVERVSKLLGFELPEDYEYDTVGGFVMAQLGKMPDEGDEFVYDGYKFRVDKMEGNRVVSVLIIAMEEEKV